MRERRPMETTTRVGRFGAAILIGACTGPLAWFGSALDAQASSAREVVIYASDLPGSALSEFSFRRDPASPGAKMAATPNTGGDLDPPPENDPHVTFKVPVLKGIPYRCWIHMKVGQPKGKSQANLLYVQFTDAVDTANKEAYKPGTKSYLTVRGPTRPGWTWVGGDLADTKSTEPVIQFRTTGDITIRLQAGMEGVAFDQFVLSPARFMDKAPAEAIVKK
jgi:hypothetical protein